MFRKAHIAGRWLSCLLALISLAPELTAQMVPVADKAAPAAQYMRAYDSMQQADWAKEQGLREDAWELYSEALVLLQKIQIDYPAWESDLIAYRIRYCVMEAQALLQTPPAAIDSRPAPLIPAPVLVAEDETRWQTELSSALQKERSNKIKNALEIYLTVLEDQAFNRAALQGAGRCYLKLNMLSEARTLLQRARLLPEPDNQLNLLQAMVYCHDQEFYKAYQLMLVVLDQEPTNALGHLVMGVAQAGLQHLPAARRATQKALQLDPKLAEAHYNLALLSLKLKPDHPNEARAAYLQALRGGMKPDPTLEKRLR